MSKNPNPVRAWVFECKPSLNVSISLGESSDCEKMEFIPTQTRKQAVNILKTNYGWEEVSWPNKEKKKKVWCCARCLEVKKEDPDLWEYNVKMERKYYLKDE